MKRLFIAVPVDGALRRLLAGAQRAIRTHGARVRWTREDQLHMTLKFIGDTPDEQIPQVIAAVRQAARETPCGTIEVGGGGCFPPRGPVRVLWVGGQDSGRVVGLVVQRLEDSLADLGVPPETRTFSIHFTLGRVKFDDSRGRLRAEVESLDDFKHHLAVGEVILYESRLSSSGPEYDVLHREPLASSGHT